MTFEHAGAINRKERGLYIRCPDPGCEIAEHSLWIPFRESGTRPSWEIRGSEELTKITAYYGGS